MASTDTANHIVRFVIPQMHGGPLIPAVPRDGHNAVNVICGPNNVGKTFMLRALDCHLAATGGQGRYIGYSITLAFPNRPVNHHYSYHIKYKEAAGTISARDKPATKNRTGYFRLLPASFFLDQLRSPAVSSSIPLPSALLTREQWIYEPGFRAEVLESIPTSEQRVFPCDQSHPVAARFQATFGCTMGFRKPKDYLELVLQQSSGLTLAFPSWGDGQKTFFYLLLAIHYAAPDVLLVDELENHLHPELMSEILALCKESVPQTIIATHHPHLIFSRYVDKVFYFELAQKPDSGATAAGLLSKFPKQPTPARTVTTLENDFLKLSRSYRLFNPQDSALLQQAQRVSHMLDIKYYQELLDAFSSPAIEATRRSLPDRQSQNFASVLPWRPAGLRILDVGAGLGRVEQEMAKGSRSSPFRRVSWVALEPNAQAQESLRRLKEQGHDISVVGSFDEIGGERFDVVLLCNVLHELTPDAFAEILVQVTGAIEDDGAIVIGELCPLLHVEKYAVPYSQTDLKDLLSGLGFGCVDRGFPVLDVQGYLLCATGSTDVELEYEVVRAKILSLWDAIRQRAIADYAGRSHLSDYVDYRNMLGSLTTLASIESYKERRWR